MSHLKLLRDWAVKSSSELGGLNWSSPLKLKTQRFVALMTPACNLAERYWKASYNMENA